jgi:prepilin-type N-terminal cleavage/methylation domain-containing protein
MGHRSEPGFTLVEVAIALVVLAVGVLALVGSSAMVTRMIGHGRQATLTSQVGTARIEWLRQLAGSTSPLCTHAQLTGGSAFTSGIGEDWVVPGAGDARQITLALAYRVPRGAARDTLVATLFCGSPS